MVSLPAVLHENIDPTDSAASPGTYDLSFFEILSACGPAYHKRIAVGNEAVSKDWFEKLQTEV